MLTSHRHVMQLGELPSPNSGVQDALARTAPLACAQTSVVGVTINVSTRNLCGGPYRCWGQRSNTCAYFPLCLSCVDMVTPVDSSHDQHLWDSNHLRQRAFLGGRLSEDTSTFPGRKAGSTSKQRNQGRQLVGPFASGSLEASHARNLRWPRLRRCWPSPLMR